MSIGFWGEDVRAAGQDGAMDPYEEMRRRRRERDQAQGADGQSAGFAATQGGQPNQWMNRQAPAGVQNYEQQMRGGEMITSRAEDRYIQPPQRGPQSGVTNDAAPRPTFNDMQRQGRARPAPPRPAQQPQQGAQQAVGEAESFGGRMIETRAEPGQINPWTGQMTPPRSPQGGQQAPANGFDVGSWLQQQLGGMGPAATAPMTVDRRGAANIAGLMGMNTAAYGMPGQAYNPGQFNSLPYLANLSGAVNTAAGDFSPAMYGAGTQTASRPGMYGQTDLPTYTAQALNAGGLDVAKELANLYKTGSRGVSDEVSQAISQSIANPSAYTSDRVKEIYGQLGQGIDDEFKQRETALREEMAGRGLSDSSIQGGRLQDLNVGRRSAQTDLANRLGQAATQDFASARSAAIGQGMQRDAANLGATTGMLGQLLGTQQAGANLGLQNFNAQLQRGQLENSMNRGRYADDLSGAQFQSGLDQQRFDMNRGRFSDQLANAQFQQGVRQQNVQNQMGLGNQALNFFNANAGFGQQNFQNQMGLAQANDQLTGNRFGRELQGLNYLSGLDQQDFGNAMARAQFNQQAGDQRYQQGLGYLDRLMGYGQQAFQNDMTQAEFNRAMQNDQDRMMMQLLGLGG